MKLRIELEPPQHRAPDSPVTVSERRWLGPVLAWLDWEVWGIAGEWYHVGVWTGPDGDLMCVRRCRTYGEAEYRLSAGSPTLLGATLRAMVLRFTGLRRLSFTTPTDVDPDDLTARQLLRRKWFYTTDGSGDPRRDTWWPSWKARAWIAAYDRDRARPFVEAPVPEPTLQYKRPDD